MNREPSITLGAVATAVASALALLIAFGVDLTKDQQVAILGVIAAVGPLVAGIAIRFKVFAPANVAVVFGPQGYVAGPASVRTPGTRVAPPTWDELTAPAQRLPRSDDELFNERGDYNASSLLVSLACLVIIVIGLVWLVRTF